MEKGLEVAKMTDETKAKSKQVRHFDRVTLDAEALSRIDGWIEQLTSHNKGVNLSRKDCLNWLVNHHSASLTQEEVAELGAKFFDEIRFLSQSLKEMRAARARGETVNLESVLKHPKNDTAVSTPKKQRRPRVKLGSSNDQTDSGNEHDPRAESSTITT